VKDEGIYTKVAFAIQNQRYLLNVYSQGYYRVSIETRVVYSLSTGDKSSDLAWAFTYFSGEQNFSTTDISHTFCQSTTKFGRVRVWPIETYFPNFVNFGPGVP